MKTLSAERRFPNFLDKIIAAKLQGGLYDVRDVLGLKERKNF
jgi:hypothetical protein